MAITQEQVLVAAGTNCAVGTGAESEAVDLSASLKMAITAKVTNGTTGPTSGCLVLVQVRSSNARSWHTWASDTAGTANNGAYEFSFDLPFGIRSARVRFQGNTDEDVTVEAFGHELISA